MSDLISRAKTYATLAHKRIDQRRKYSNQPYHVHLEAVASIVATVSDDEEMIAAAWLYFRPHESIMGGADAGVYVSLGAEIAQHGSFRLVDEALAALAAFVGAVEDGQMLVGQVGCPLDGHAATNPIVGFVDLA